MNTELFLYVTLIHILFNINLYILYYLILHYITLYYIILIIILRSPLLYFIT